MNIYVVSDLHLGDKSPADNFFPIESRFKQFLDMVEQDKNHLLILNGDIFEIWQCRMGDIVIQYNDLLSRLVNMNTVFIVGNHDIDLIGMENVPGGCWFFDKFKTFCVIEKEGKKKITIKHGHQLDMYNNPGTSLVTPRVMSLLMSALEKLYPDSRIEGFTKKYIEPMARNTMKFILHIYETVFFKDHKNDASTHLDSLDKYRKEYPEGILVSGHTHRAGWYENWYVNSGTWEDGENSYYIKITDDNNIVLFSFPENKIIDKQCEGTEYSEYSIKKMWQNRKN